MQHLSAAVQQHCGAPCAGCCCANPWGLPAGAPGQLSAPAPAVSTAPAQCGAAQQPVQPAAQTPLGRPHAAAWSGAHCPAGEPLQPPPTAAAGQVVYVTLNRLLNQCMQQPSKSLSSPPTALHLCVISGPDPQNLSGGTLPSLASMCFAPTFIEQQLLGILELLCCCGLQLSQHILQLLAFC